MEEFCTEVVVAAFALDSLDDDCRYSVGIVCYRMLDLFQRLGFEPLYLSDVVFERECDLGVDNARPICELGETLVLVGVIGVGDGKRVSAAAVERFVEVHDLCSDFSVVRLSGGYLAGGKKLADLPVHCDLEGILDSQCAVVDKECVFVAFGNSHLSEHLYKLGHFLCINVGVRDLVDGCAEDLFLEFGGLKLGVVHPKGR